ncbi:AIR synthase-related protein, partial [Persicitalea sp.]|uniref:AIR synthase-related protein n=1 Tax=Persicitalea sp. TaxID=3100273 RepID=UPI00359406F6
GSKTLLDPVQSTPLNVGQLILSPTRTYAPVAKALLDELRAEIHGMVHCSGGAQTKILHFIDNLHVVKDNLFPIPPLFKLIQAESGTSWQEMYQVFNMGHRLEVYLPEAQAARVIEISESFGIAAQVVGRVEAATKKRLTIRSEFGEFLY